MAKTAAPKRPFPPFKPLPGDPKNFAFNAIGEDSAGHSIWHIGSHDPGGMVWVFYETAPGQRVTIYRGTVGDASGFVPDQAMTDSTGIWFANYDNQTIWHWRQGTNLRKVVIKGLPPPLKGANSYVYVTPAGACF